MKLAAESGREGGVARTLSISGVGADRETSQNVGRVPHESVQKGKKVKKKK